ncbi:uncharacterized protein LOC107882930 [Acyrthosiphon pisum]|uniref:Odorant receptor n=1 Tax=Acyrthosiphon pisum TaxID=7029 RepID=A0A8R2NUU7_ACYPI|nr:uncharacterized protein LOC107882930 [Acyrthosiphon pisum]
MIVDRLLKDILCCYLFLVFQQYIDIITIDIRNETNHVFNIKLAKLLGLYQILDPGALKCRGRNIYHIVTSCLLLYACLISTILIISGLYYCTNIPVSIDYFWKSVTTIYVIYKTWIIIHYSNDVWNCLSITRYDLTSLTDRNRHILDRWRERLAWLTNIYVIMYCMTLVLYLVITLAFSEVKSTVKNRDGSVGYYRQNALNLYLIATDDTYNVHYYTFYFIEASFVAFITLYFLIFDVLMVTLCFGMCCQMEIICSAFKSVGHKFVTDPHSPIDDIKNQTSNEHDLIYDELKTIIMDHQVVMKKYEDFLTIFRRVMLLHIFVSSFTVILLWFTFIMSFSNDDRFKTSDVIIIRMICEIPSILFQIYMMCYLFGNINDQKDEIIFALYSSNWTEMDMKCKKLILLTMQLNNANQIKLKFTRTKIVNLEMFFKTMGHCYTVISVLVNHIQTKNE